MRMPSHLIRLLALLLCLVSAEILAADVEDVVRLAFLATHDGWSSDEVLVNEELNTAFLAACRERLPAVDDRTFNWEMLNMRKAGQLGGRVTKRTTQRHAPHRHAAEIAARRLEDTYRQNMDQVLCDPTLRVEFDAAARELAPEVSTYLLRKAALGLRKSRRLRPELVVRVADWGRTIATHSLAELQSNLTLVPRQPGVYLFLDSSGYL